jgi:iron(III) transport system ATP-binding protein
MDVEITDLQLHYGDFHAVKGIDLTIEDGSALVLLGPSGCGKTSTMRTVAGLETPTGGRIAIGGRTVFDAEKRINVAPNRRNIGMVFQSYAVWPHRTVRQNVEYPLRVRKVARAARRATVERILELTGLTEYAERGASRLSGGQMQRVALARSLAMSPSVLLLDEPLSNLDALLRENLRNELRRIQQESGLTSVYVTHDQSEALALADKIALMRAGRIVQVGSPSDLFESPTDSEAARFMGFENILPIADGDTGLRLGGRPIAPATTDDVDEIEETVGEASAASPPAGRPAASEFLCVRAENVEILPDGEHGATPATVAVATYQGRGVEYDCHLDGGQRVRVRASGACPRYARGDAVGIRIDADSGLVLSGAARA